LRAQRSLGVGRGQGFASEAEGCAEVQTGLITALHRLHEGLGMSPHRHDALLVLQAPVVKHTVHLVVVGRVPDLRDQDLDLERLYLLREDPPKRLRVGVRDRFRGHVLTTVGVAAEVG